MVGKNTFPHFFHNKTSVGLLAPLICREKLRDQ